MFIYGLGQLQGFPNKKRRISQQSAKSKPYKLDGTFFLAKSHTAIIKG
jgi:hypothetical protein